MAITWQDTTIVPRPTPQIDHASFDELVARRDEMRTELQGAKATAEIARAEHQQALTVRSTTFRSLNARSNRQWREIGSVLYRALLALLMIAPLIANYTVQLYRAWRIEGARIKQAQRRIASADQQVAQTGRQLALLLQQIGSQVGEASDLDEELYEPLSHVTTPSVRSPAPRPVRRKPRKVQGTGTKRHRIVAITAVLALVAIAAGLIVGTASSDGAAPQSTPKVTKTKAPSGTTGSKPKAATQPASLDPAAINLAKDNALPAWIRKSSLAKAALSPWQDLVVATAQDPRVIAHTKSGQAVNEAGSYFLPGTTQWHQGQQAMIKSIMLLGSGGNPAYAKNGMVGLVPMTTSIVMSVAKEMGISVNPKKLSAQESMLLAERRINDIYASLLDSKALTAKLKTITNGPAVVTDPGTKQAYSREFLMKDLYPSMFLGVWYNLVDFASGTMKSSKNGSPASAQLMQATHSLYLDWARPSSQQFKILIGQPSMRSLLAHK